MQFQKDTSLEIQTILDKNRVNDLKGFLKKRQCLNATNMYLIYLFHLVQSAGILTTSFAAGSNDTKLVWIGIGLNFLASLISVYEKTNSSLLKKLLNDINLIKDGNYIDEGELIDTDTINVQKLQMNKKTNISNNENDTNLKTPLLNNIYRNHTNNNIDNENNIDNDNENDNEKGPIKFV